MTEPKPKMCDVWRDEDGIAVFVIANGKAYYRKPEAMRNENPLDERKIGVNRRIL